MSSNETTETGPQRRCPECGTPVAQKAETCLMCGAPLKEKKTRNVRLPQVDLLLPLLVVAGIVVLWFWRPWQADPEPQAMAPEPTGATVTATATATPTPQATFEVAPTATPLYSPTPPPTATLPPNQTRHTVASGETVSTIRKLYGTTIEAILEANGLKSNSILSVGQELIIPLPIANTSTPTPTLTPSPTPFLYTIRTADTLSAIAKKYKTTVEALMDANAIVDATRIRVGTKIMIVQPPDYTSTMAYETYEVNQGDTLISISSKYNVTVAEIREANEMEDNRLSAGQELKIPVGTATPTPTLTPTPGPPYPAPVQLAPPDGAAFEGAETVILINWASVGILEEDAWYVIRLRRTGDVVQQLPLVWTKTTSLRLPSDLYVEGLTEPQRFLWQIAIMRQTGVDEDDTPTGEIISPWSGTRTFTWK